MNHSQSTNDVYPTALQLAVLACSTEAVTGLDAVARALDDAAERHAGLERLGRTLPAGCDAGTHRRRASRTGARGAAGSLERRRGGDRLHHVPLDGTAVGTGLGAPVGYQERAVERLARRTGLPLQPAGDLFDAFAHLDPLLAVANRGASAAITLAKIAADLRFLASGPIGGIGEMQLPARQVGSSIMPGKVNPVIPELVLQASFEIRGAAHTVELAVAAGELELNVMEPVIALHLPDALLRLASVAHVFAERYLSGLAWDRGTVALHLAGSLEAAVLAGHEAAGAEERPSGRRED